MAPPVAWSLYSTIAPRVVLKADVARFDSFQYRSLRRLLLARFRAIEHISYASIIHICRSTGVDIMPISIMISKRRLSYFGQVCRMDSAYRLPKIMLHSQLLGDTGSLSRGRGAPETSYKSALLEDMRNFGIMDGKSKDNCCINTLKWEMLLEMMSRDLRHDRRRRASYSQWWPWVSPLFHAPLLPYLQTARRPRP